MKSDYVFAALLVMIAVAIGVAGNLTGSNSNYCPPPSAASVATLFAPCQAFESAMGHRVSKQEAVQMGLLAPDQRPEPATRLATPGIVAQRLANATRMISTADINVSGLCLERVVLRAIMDISAHSS